MAAFLKKYRNPLLVVLLLVTMTVSYFVNQSRMAGETQSVTLPVTVPETQSELSALETFRARREETVLADIAALQALCDQDKLDAQTRQDAAEQLQAIISRRERQTELEGALALSGVAPCAAVLSEGTVTIVTEKPTLTSGESALVLTLCKAHADVEPSGVRVMTADEYAP